MLKIRDAKALFAATVIVAPWNLVLFDAGVGWGLTFPFGRFVVVRGETQFLGPFELLSLYLELGSQGFAGTLVTLAWIAAVALAVFAAASVIEGRLRRGGTTVAEDRRAALGFAVAGALFVVSRILGASVLTWTSVPIGALYLLFVGAVFYWGLFRLGTR